MASMPKAKKRPLIQSDSDDSDFDKSDKVENIDPQWPSAIFYVANNLQLASADGVGPVLYINLSTSCPTL